MRFKISLAVLLTFGLLAAGCGGDDETTSSTTTAEATGASGASGASGEAGATGLLPADFAAEANAICKAGDAELDKAFSGLGQNPTNSQIEDLATDEFVPNVQGQIDGIRALGEPDEGADELTTFLDDAQTALDDVSSDPSLIAQGDDPFADVGKQADALGMTECAN